MATAKSPDLDKDEAVLQKKIPSYQLLLEKNDGEFLHMPIGPCTRPLGQPKGDIQG